MFSSHMVIFVVIFFFFFSLVLFSLGLHFDGLSVVFGV